MKKIIVPLVIILILAGVFAYIKFNPVQNQNQPAENKDTYDPKNPNFILGSVVSSSADKIEFKAGTTSGTALISSSTKLVKQVKDKTSLQVVDASLADFKANTTIVVYFDEQPVDKVYKATKVQIISQ